MTQPEKVSVAPTKTFFVSMLTRDIDLEDAILDLLDNCVDGIHRSSQMWGPKPYEGFEAEIKFNAEEFAISDNCGGIPWNKRSHAFRMGRPASSEPVDGALGVYGIGMKRAIFKIGERCRVTTRNADDQYEINITPEWLDDKENWEIDVERHDSATLCPGTAITVSNLHGNIAKQFTKNEGRESFSSDLMQTVSGHYANIIGKGFKVTINDTVIPPKPIKIAYDPKWKESDCAIVPFVFKSKTKDVEVYLAVGLTRNIPAEDELDMEQETVTRASKDAGWTIVCNDRAVVYRDRNKLTGWGDSGVPKYHTQFIAISGIVEFKSKDPSKLPTTTTKRGIDKSSELYRQVKIAMRNGMTVFTSYTNKWKRKSEESDEHFKQCDLLSLAELKIETENWPFDDAPILPNGKQYTPSLPMPPRRTRSTNRISFTKEKTEIQAVADYFKRPEMLPGEVGSKCFDITLKRSKR